MSGAIEPDRVEGALYLDETAFDREMDRIFHRGWVFVGHASEVREPGEFVSRDLGSQPVLMVRGDDGEVRLFANRCPHRGAEVCSRDRGRTRHFRCAYHGWTFDTEGTLVALPHRDGYGPELDHAQLGLAAIPQTDDYRGFVFGSWAEAGPSLAEHLGRARSMIDHLCDLSPVGEVEIRSGWLKHRVDANWKILAENVCDFYHPPTTHGSSQLSPSFFRDSTGARARSLEGGHGEMDFRPTQASRPHKPLDQFTGPTRRYLELLAERDGAEEAVARRRLGPPHGLVFPNLFIAGQNLFVIQPRRVDRTSHLQTPVFYVGAPAEINRRQLRRFEGASGPAGMLEPDDSAVWERVQRGLRAERPRWVRLQRGVDEDDSRDGASDGVREGRMLDETTLRGFWRHYSTVMSAR